MLGPKGGCHERVARPGGEVIAPSFYEPMPLTSDQISQVTGGALQSSEPPSGLLPVPPIGFPPIIAPAAGPCANSEGSTLPSVIRMATPGHRGRGGKDCPQPCRCRGLNGARRAKEHLSRRDCEITTALRKRMKIFMSASLFRLEAVEFQRQRGWAGATTTPPVATWLLTSFFASSIAIAIIYLSLGNFMGGRRLCQSADASGRHRKGDAADLGRNI